MAEDEAISPAEYRRLCDFLYRRTGMSFTDSRRYFVEHRVVERIARSGAGSFASYFARLHDDRDGEVEKLINILTVNETYFYREEHQLTCLTTDLLAERLAAERSGDSLRLWSVPCSTGEEPYSIAIWLLENWPMVDAYDVEIVGSDIDTRVLDAARAGIFDRRALQRLPPGLVEKYFTPLGPERWQIVDDLRRSVRFTTANIIERSATLPHGLFDVIFCRNVLIYFDDASRRVAAENLYENLAPGGYICLGHAESMSRISPLFEVRRFADAIVYRRPPGTSHV